MTEVLENSQERAIVASSGIAEELPAVLGLEIQEIGPIALPLSDYDAQRLAAKCTIAPFGRNKETVVDEKVRKTLVLPPDQVHFSNLEWKKELEELLERIQK